MNNLALIALDFHFSKQLVLLVKRISATILMQRVLFVVDKSWPCVFCGAQKIVPTGMTEAFIVFFFEH